jgi:hypothetical protein
MPMLIVTAGGKHKLGPWQVTITIWDWKHVYTVAPKDDGSHVTYSDERFVLNFQDLKLTVASFLLLLIRERWEPFLSHYTLLTVDTVQSPCTVSTSKHLEPATHTEFPASG